jgi:hypothetical protein
VSSLKHQHANCAPSTRGRVVALCCCCGKRSKPCLPDKDGEPDTFAISRGWSVAPYPHDCQHSDGSVGSMFTCPSCNERLRAGEVLVLRDGTRERLVT